jgi:DNA-binding transcriptional LysR family regulator
LDNIEAFVVAAASPSFSAAAESLALSPAAFSRRIQALSDHVGVKLFERCASGVRLTEAGKSCLAEVEPAYRELLRATTAIGQREQGRTEVRLSLSHSMAVGWLIPRMTRFQERHPGIELTFKTHRGAACLRRGEVDLAICFNDIDLKGLDAEPLLGISCAPVAAPAIAARHRSAEQGRERYRLLSVETAPGLWSWWSQETGVDLGVETSHRFDTLHAMYESACQGAGVAMGSSANIQPHLDTGRLEGLGLPVVRLADAYWLAAHAGRTRAGAVDKVRRWLRAEAAETVDGLAAAA